MIKVENEFLRIIYLIEYHNTEMLKPSSTPL